VKPKSWQPKNERETQLLIILESTIQRARQYRYMIAEFMYRHDELVDETIEYIIENLERDPVALAAIFVTYESAQEELEELRIPRTMEQYLYALFSKYGKALLRCKRIQVCRHG